MSNVLKRILRNPILDFMFALILLGTIYFPFLFVLVYAIFSNNLYHVDSKLILFLFAPSDFAFFMGGLLGIIIGCVGMKNRVCHEGVKEDGYLFILHQKEK